MRCCSFRVRLYIRLECVVRACTYALYVCRSRDYKLASIHVWSLCLCSTMHMHQLSYDKSTDFVSLSSFPPSFSSLSLPPSLLRTPTLSLSLCFPPFLSRVSPSSATVSCTCTSRFVCTRTRRTHRELQPLSVLFYSHPRRSIAWASLSR